MTADRHNWLASGINPDPDAQEIRRLAEQAGLPELADKFIIEGLSPQQVRDRLFEALCAKHGQVPATIE